MEHRCLQDRHVIKILSDITMQTMSFMHRIHHWDVKSVGFAHDATVHVISFFHHRDYVGSLM